MSPASTVSAMLPMPCWATIGASTTAIAPVGPGRPGPFTIRRTRRPQPGDHRGDQAGGRADSGADAEGERQRQRDHPDRHPGQDVAAPGPGQLRVVGAVAAAETAGRPGDHRGPPTGAARRMRQVAAAGCAGCRRKVRAITSSSRIEWASSGRRRCRPVGAPPVTFEHRECLGMGSSRSRKDLAGGHGRPGVGGNLQHPDCAPGGPAEQVGLDLIERPLGPGEAGGHVGTSDRPFNGLNKFAIHCRSARPGLKIGPPRDRGHTGVMDPVAAFVRSRTTRTAPADPRRVMAYHKPPTSSKALDEPPAGAQPERCWQSLPGVRTKRPPRSSPSLGGPQASAAQLRSAAADLGGGDIRTALHRRSAATPTGPTARRADREMMTTAAALGTQYCALTDHSPRLKIANGLAPDRLRRQLDAIDRTGGASRAVPDSHRHRVDILGDGTPGPGPELLDGSTSWSPASISNWRWTPR